MKEWGLDEAGRLFFRSELLNNVLGSVEAFSCHIWSPSHFIVCLA